MKCVNLSLSLLATAALLLPAGAAEDRIFPGFSVQNRLRVEFDDNIRESPEGAEDASWKFMEEVEFLYNMSDDATTLGLRAMPSFTVFGDRDEDETDFHQQLDFSVQHRASETLTLSLKEVLRRAELPELIDQDIGLVRQNNDYLYNSVHGGVTAGMTPNTSLSVKGRHELLAYDAKDVAATSDYTKWVADLAVGIKLSPTSTLSGEAGWERADYDQGVRSYDSAQTGLAVETQATPDTFLHARAGYEFRTFDESTIDDSNSPYISAGLTYRAAESTRLNASIGYYMSQTPTASFATQDRFATTLGIFQALASDLTLDAYASLLLGSADAEYATSLAEAGLTGYDSTELRIGSRLSYLVNPDNSLELGWDFMDFDTDTDGSFAGNPAGLRDYARNRYSLGWRVRL